MANDYDTKGRNVGVAAIAAATTRLSLHSGDPGGADGAANELAGGGYARQVATWGAAAAGAADLTPAPVFSVAAGATVAWVAGWDTAGTSRYWKRALAAPVGPYAAAGTFTLDDADLDLNDA